MDTLALNQTGAKSFLQNKCQAERSLVDAKKQFEDKMEMEKLAYARSLAKDYQTCLKSTIESKDSIAPTDPAPRFFPFVAGEIV